MKTIFFFICISLCTTYIYAQTNYYAVTKTFNENGYTYQCDVAASKTVTLYNKSNKLLFTTQSYKNTGETFSQTDEGIALLQYDAWTRAERLSIVNTAFSASEKQRVKGSFRLLNVNLSEKSFTKGNLSPRHPPAVSLFHRS